MSLCDYLYNAGAELFVTDLDDVVMGQAVDKFGATPVESNEIYALEAKAKELRKFIEPIVTFAKRGDLHARRQVLKKIPHKSIVKELFENIGPLYQERNGGYTRIIKLGFRDNDCAPVSIIEFVDFEVDTVTAAEE